jgi:hypothetical protein
MHLSSTTKKPATISFLIPEDQDVAGFAWSQNLAQRAGCRRP